MHKLTEPQRIALDWYKHAIDIWSDNRPPGIPVGVLGGLVRKGLLISTIQSEHVQGERRFSWAMYKITPAGLAVLQSQGTQNG